MDIVKKAKRVFKRIEKSPVFAKPTMIEISLTLLGHKPKMIFDIGANVGQGLAWYSKNYPDAVVHAFEPFPDNFLKLEEAALSHPKVSCHAMGMGSKEGEMNIQDDAIATMTRLSATGGEQAGTTVPIGTVDSFCARHGIERINFLKVDTEGHDLEVLKGAEAMLRKSEIDVMDVEVGMNVDNKYHVPLHDVQVFLEGFGYRLFGLHEQTNEWPTKRPNLRRANAVFISPDVIASKTPYVPKH